MSIDSEHRSELAGYTLWLFGSALFMISTAKSEDVLGFLASSLFLVGILFVMVPMLRRSK